VAEVWENEPDISLETMNIADIATPHIAGYSFDGKVNGIEMIYNAACTFYSRNRQWRASQYVDTKIAPIDICHSENALHAAVEKAYPVMDDDAKLRELAKQEPDRRGAYFDALRRHYPKRREFRHFSVNCSADTMRFEAALKGLGFAAPTK
jgi:erythronate-4-phosphate dehydrogenase